MCTVLPKVKYSIFSIRNIANCCVIIGLDLLSLPHDRKLLQYYDSLVLNWQLHPVGILK